MIRIFLFCVTVFISVDSNSVSLVGKQVFNNVGVKVIYKGSAGQIRYQEGSITLFCGYRKSMTDFPPLDEVISAELLVSFECRFPPVPLSETLNKININASAIKRFSLSSSEREPLPKGNYTIGLNLESLELETPIPEGGDFFINNADFLEPLFGLKTLIVIGTVLPRIPDHVHLESLTLRRASVRSWGNCRYLKELTIINLQEDKLLADWPTNCSQLKSLTLQGMEVEMANRAVSILSTASEKLQSLNMTQCGLNRLPVEILNSAKDLSVLNLAKNILNDVYIVEMPVLKKLSILDLTENKLVGLGLFDLAKQVPVLRTLILDKNSIVNLFCAVQSRLVTFAAHLPMLQRLSFNGNDMDMGCFKGVHFSNLTSLQFNSAGKVETIMLQDFPSTDAKELVINISKRIVTRFRFEDDDYKMIQEGNYSSFWRTSNGNNTKLTILLDYLDCDCENYWLSKSLRENSNLISIPNVKCRKTGKYFLEEDIDTLDCNLGIFDDCILRSYPTLGRVFKDNGKSYRNSEVECHNIKTPHVDYPVYDENYRFKGLNISDNHVSSLNDFDLPDSVQWIDLRGNTISRLAENETAQLFIPNRRVWLSRNLFICDCESAAMLDFLHEHKSQIMDYDQIACFESGKLMSTVTSYDACQIGLKIILGIVGALLVIMTIVAGVLFRYRFHVRIYLFSRGWCLPCLAEDDEDPERPYDVFLSFAHGDWDYVTQKLLPQLEGEPHSYRVCVHYRDWVVGDWIPNQIMRSVSVCKRTIILLSKNFVRSMWGSLEFRYALASAAKEGRPRLVVLVLDDVLDEALDEELKGYLHYNTYLSCNDPWFWEKLRYAMPHRKGTLAPVNPTSQSTQTEGHGVIDPHAHNVINMEPLAIGNPVVDFP